MKVLNVDGVVQIVSFGGKPTPIPDEEIHALRRVLSGNYEIEVIPFLKKGETVEIIAGPLRGFRGILLRNSSPLRFVISVEIIGRSVAVRVAPHLLRSVSDNRKSKKQSV